MRYFAVIDTNVLVSAMLKWESVPGSILNLAMDGPIVPVLNDAILREYREVLFRPKFHLTDNIVSDIIESIKKEAVFVDEEHINIDLPDPKDRIFYEVVLEKRKDEDAYLVTGNINHFAFFVMPKDKFSGIPCKFSIQLIYNLFQI